MRFKGRVADIALTVALSLLVLSGVLLLWGCGKAEPSAPGVQEEEGAPVGEAKEETVTLTLYFGRSVEEREWLYPEQRTVTGASDPYRAAMEQLVQGPAPDTQLHAVLPDTVKVLGIEVADGICTVNLSAEVLTDANQVGVSASSEGLALSAIANTLTEFEGAGKVRLLIEGMQSGMLEGRYVEDFWGHMGLPEYLERNEGIIYKEPG